jgi:hypothetical protein
MKNRRVVLFLGSVDRTLTSEEKSKRAAREAAGVGNYHHSEEEDREVNLEEAEDVLKRKSNAPISSGELDFGRGRTFQKRGLSEKVARENEPL